MSPITSLTFTHALLSFLCVTPLHPPQFRREWTNPFPEHTAKGRLTAMKRAKAKAVQEQRRKNVDLLYEMHSR